MQHREEKIVKNKSYYTLLIIEKESNMIIKESTKENQTKKH